MYNNYYLHYLPKNQFSSYQKYIFRLSSQQVILFSQDIDDIIHQYFVIALQRNLINTGIYVQKEYIVCKMYLKIMTFPIIIGIELKVVSTKFFFGDTTITTLPPNKCAQNSKNQAKVKINAKSTRQKYLDQVVNLRRNYIVLTMF